MCLVIMGLARFKLLCGWVHWAKLTSTLQSLKPLEELLETMDGLSKTQQNTLLLYLVNTQQKKVGYSS